MSAPIAKTQEPSMEEILASIRRIIADDQDLGHVSDDYDAAEDGPGVSDAPAEIAAAVVPEETEAHPIAAITPAAEVPAPGPPPLELDLEDLTFGEPGRQTAPVAAPAAAEPAPRPIPSQTAKRAFPPQPGADTPRRADSLISTEATASIGQAFNMLSHTVLSQNARTLEDLVKDMLKPMLKTWLDDNLPPMVERLIRAEIERVARGR